MKIFIYGDSNTWGYIPNENGYSKDAVQRQYDKEVLWWYGLSKKYDVVVDAKCGRAISHDGLWDNDRNASKTIYEDLKMCEDVDVVMIMLGTNDCKSDFLETAESICKNLEKLILIIKEKTNADIVVMLPPKIVDGTKVTGLYYKNGEVLSCEIGKCYAEMAKRNGYDFISTQIAEIGEDGEHLTEKGHRQIASVVENFLEQKIESSHKE